MTQMTQDELSVFWFWLTDANGCPFKRCTIASASLPPWAIVDQLRDKVKKKFPNRLSLYDAPDLIVFANRHAYLNRKNCLDRTEPLTEDAPIRGLGSTKKDAIIVAVPDMTPTPKTASEKYWSTLSSHIARVYQFPYTHGTFQDILDAKEGEQGPDWCFRRATEDIVRFGSSGLARDVDKGQRYTDIPLPALYTAKEWQQLIDLFHSDYSQLTEKDLDWSLIHKIP